MLITNIVMMFTIS